MEQISLTNLVYQGITIDGDLVYLTSEPEPVTNYHQVVRASKSGYVKDILDFKPWEKHNFLESLELTTTEDTLPMFLWFGSGEFVYGMDLHPKELESILKDQLGIKNLDWLKQLKIK